MDTLILSLFRQIAKAFTLTCCAPPLFAPGEDRVGSRMSQGFASNNMDENPVFLNRTPDPVDEGMLGRGTPPNRSEVSQT